MAGRDRRRLSKLGSPKFPRLHDDNVTTPAEIMTAGKTEILEGGTVRWQLVGDEGVRHEALFLQQFAYQFERGLLVPAGLDQ